MMAATLYLAGEAGMLAKSVNAGELSWERIDIDYEGIIFRYQSTAGD